MNVQVGTKLCSGHCLCAFGSPGIRGVLPDEAGAGARGPEGLVGQRRHQPMRQVLGALAFCLV